MKFGLEKLNLFTNFTCKSIFLVKISFKIWKFGFEIDLLYFQVKRSCSLNQDASPARQEFSVERSKSFSISRTNPKMSHDESQAESVRKRNSAGAVCVQRQHSIHQGNWIDLFILTIYNYIARLFFIFCHIWWFFKVERAVNILCDKIQ